MLQKTLRILLLCIICCNVAFAQNKISFFNFLDYTSVWKYSAYFNKQGNVGNWNEIYHIKGDTIIENKGFYKVFMQYQLFDETYKLKKLTETFAYSLREDKDSLFHFVMANGSAFSISHATSNLENSYPYKQAFKNAPVPFITYYENQQYGAACGFLQGIGASNCPPNTNGVSYLDCYSKKDKRTNPAGAKCDIILENVTNVDDVRSGSIRVFPNPVSSDLFIELEGIEADEASSVTLNNMQGKIQQKHKLGYNNRLDMSDYCEGVYFLNIQTKSRQFFYKIIK